MKQKCELVLFYFYFSFIAVVWRPTIKEPTMKQKFVLFYFNFNFIAFVRAALQNLCSAIVLVC